MSEPNQSLIQRKLSQTPKVIPVSEPPPLLARHHSESQNEVNNVVDDVGPTPTSLERIESRTGAAVVRRPGVEFITPSPRRVSNDGDEDSYTFQLEEQNTDFESGSFPPGAVEAIPAVLAEDVESAQEPEESEEPEQSEQPEQPLAYSSVESSAAMAGDGQRQCFVSVPENREKNQEASKISRRTLLLFTVVLTLAIVVVVAAVLVVEGSKTPYSVPPQKTETWKTVERLVAPLSGEDVLYDVKSPQYRALSWMAEQNRDVIRILNEERIIQRYVLGVLYFATGGAEWNKNLRFLSTGNECMWKGASSGKLSGVVGCDSNGRVVDLMLDGNSLFGTIPKEVGFLSSLTNLQLNANFIEGSIVSSLGQLQALKVLNLANNSITGTIPSELGQLNMLSALRLNNNNLSGQIPPILGKLGKMRTLDLTSNKKLRGTIPSTFADLHLENARIGGTNITGNVTFICGAVKGKIEFDCTQVECSCKGKCVCVIKDVNQKKVLSYMSFNSLLDKNYCLNVKDGLMDPFTELELSECDDSPSQKFAFRENKIRPLLSEDVCVEMDTDQSVFLRSVCLDLWEIRLDGSLRNVGEDMCIAVHNSTARKAVPIVQEECNGTASQIWFLDDQPPYVELRSSFNRKLCLEVEAGNVKDNTRLLLWQCDGSPEQRFHLDGDGRLRSKVRPDACVESHPERGIFIHSECVDKWELSTYNGAVRKVGDVVCITVQDFSAKAGDPLVLKDCTGSDDQMWIHKYTL